jgi:hypothetical protein
MRDKGYNKAQVISRTDLLFGLFEYTSKPCFRLTMVC